MNTKTLKRLLYCILTAFIIVSCGGGSSDGDDGDVEDITPPEAPVITSHVEGATINTSTITMSGTAEAGSTVKLFDSDDTTLLGTATTDASGNWSLTSSTLADGVYILTATATDAADNTSSTSIDLTITIDTGGNGDTQPAGADMPSVKCHTLYTGLDIDEALDIWNRPRDEWATFGISKGETCGEYIDGRPDVYVQIEPGEPADFTVGAELLGVTGESLSVVQWDGALWFGGQDAEGDGLEGILAVHKSTSLGELYFRIALGRPALDNATQKEVAKNMALAVLGRFPGVEPYRIVKTPEPEDMARHGYVENLLEKEADGDWTLGEGLVETLRLFVGEVNTWEVLRNTGLRDFGTEVVRMAREYLTDGEDATAKAEIERLLAMFAQQPTREETAGTSQPFESTTATLQNNIIPRVGTVTECTSYYGQQDICWRWISIEAEKYGEESYRLMGPNTGFGWKGSHVDLLKRAMIKMIAKLHEHAIPPPLMDLVMTPHPGLGKMVNDPNFLDRCTVDINTGIQAIAAIKESQAEQLAAALIAQCSLNQLPHFPDGSFAESKWQGAGAMFLSDVVYPNAQLEQAFTWPVSLKKVETSKSMLDYSNWNWAFLEEIGSIPTVLQLLKSPASSLGSFPNIDELVHQYAKHLSEGEIADKGSPHTYTPPKQSEALESPGKSYFDVAPFQAVRIEVSVDGDDYACVSYPTYAQQVSWSPGTVGSALSWSDVLPETLQGNAVFAVTSKVAGQFVIDVNEFVADPEDCDEEYLDEDPDPPPEDCPLQVCSGTDYFH